MPKSKFTKADDVFRRMLRELRTSMRLTQAGVAARLRQSQSYVSKYELGERRLDFVETILVCEALGVDFVQFAAKFGAEFEKTRRKKET
jgi:transcriptional regulator with XRE-family HTH domain